MSERRRLRAELAATSEDRGELLDRLGLWAVATSGTFLLGNVEGARKAYARVVELAAEVGVPEPPPFDEFVLRYHDARDCPLDVWRARCGI